MALSRRHFLSVSTGAAVALTMPRGRAADQPIELQWSDLIPEGDTAVLMETLRGLGVVEHGELSTGFEQETSAAVTTEYDGKLVRLPGYVVPLDFSSTGITEFILAPFVGACIHVPPPPPNQLVFVTTTEPYPSQGLFEAVYVIGTFGTAATGTQLAEIGYALSADRIEPYE